ncbi:MAG: hypothetical protein GC171_10955 [Terrimonas sp.]|nr:hypothetical protein [Terrimonas sp.]
MRKSTLTGFLLVSLSCITALQSCIDDSNLKVKPATPDQSFVEEFDTANAAYDRGWRFINRSVALGRRNWQNPNADNYIPFPPYSTYAAGNGYLWADYTSTSSDAGVISNWAVSPQIWMKNGDKIVFYTRTELYSYLGDSTDFVNRMQVKLNPTGSLNCGNGTEVGDFTTTLLDINPFYNEFLLSNYNILDPTDPDRIKARNAYPHRWTRFEAEVFGLNEPVYGRFAFRYFIEGAGANGFGSSIGIDSVAYISK